MAFDQNLDADKIDDFGLFSILRIPLLIIGGILGIDRSNSILDEPGPDTDTDVIISNSSLTAADRYVEDDRNRISNNDSDNDQQRHERWHQPKTPSIGPSCIKSNNNNNNNNSDIQCIKRTKKKMSWSDESGLPLAAYDENSSHNHGPSSYATKRSPIKSSVRRCTRADLSSSSSRYIPSMKGSKGVLLPTRPYGQFQSTDKQHISGGTNGAEMSPQWGWYISTTPPTPELYHNSRGSPATSATRISSIIEQNNDNDSTSLDANNNGQVRENLVFRNLQKANNTPMGWTSIPI